MPLASLAGVKAARVTGRLRRMPSLVFSSRSLSGNLALDGVDLRSPVRSQDRHGPLNPSAARAARPCLAMPY